MTDRTVVYRLQVQAQQAQAQMAAFGASVKKAADDTTAATREGEKFRKGLDTLGGAAGRVGLVAGAGLGAAIMKAANFDQAMSNVQAATHESASAMDDLRQAALDAGAKTAFSATEAAAGIENLAKAGVETADILDGGLSGALDLAAAGGLDVASAAEAAAGAMAQFKLDGSQVPHIADLLAAGAGKAQGEVSDMVMALKQAGTVSAQTGLTLEETTGALAAMAEQSLLGSDAGTSFKTMLASLTPNSDKAAKAMEQYNIHAFDAQGNFVGMTELAGQLRSGLGDLTDEQRSMALETIFGSDAVRAASIIYDNGAEGIAEWTSKVDDAGYAAETAAIKQDNLRGDIEKLGGALETALIGTGDGSQGPLRSLTQNLEGAVNAYNNLGEGAKSGVAVTLAATAAIGGGLFVFSKMVQSIASTRLAMQQLGLTSVATKDQMLAVGKGASGVLLAAGAVTALGNAIADANGAAIDSSDLQRNIEALSLGEGDDSLDRIISDLEIVNMLTSDLTEPIKETVTLFGLFGNTNLDNAKDNLAQIDDALAGLVESGNGDKAAEVFDRIMEASDLDDSEVKEYFGSYQTALDNAEASSKDAAVASTTLMVANEDLAAAAEKTEAELQAEADAIAEIRKQGAATAETFLGLGDSLNDSSKSLGDWLTEMEQGAQALANFNDNSRKAAKEGLDKGLILSLRDAGKEGALRMQQLANGTEDGIKRANTAWRTQQREIEETADLTQKLAGLSPVEMKVNARTDAAMTGIANLEARLRNIADEDVFINIRHRSDGKSTGYGPQNDFAEGGPVVGPGTGTSDSIVARVSNGEHVWTAREVTNAGGHGAVEALRSMYSYADGGEVGKPSKKPKKRNLQSLDESSVNLTGFLKAQQAQANANMDAAVAQLNAAQIMSRASEVAALAAKDQDEAADKALEAAQQQYDSMKSQTAGLFNIDPLARPDSAWGANADPFSSLADIIARTSAFSAGSSALAARGLDGAALTYGLGSEDRMAQLGAMSDEDLQRFEDMFNAANEGVLQASTTAADLAYGAQVATATAAAVATQTTLDAALAQQVATANAVVTIQGQLGQFVGQLDSIAQQIGEAAANGVVNGGNKLARRGVGHD